MTRLLTLTIAATIGTLIDNQAWMEKQVDESVARILARLPRHFGRVS